MKAQIEEIINLHLGTTYDFDVGEAAAAITEMVEGRLAARDDARASYRRLLNRCGKDLAEARSRLAEMRKALELMAEESDMLYEILDDMPTCLEDLIGEEGMALSERSTKAYRQALAAAGEQDAEE